MEATSLGTIMQTHQFNACSNVTCRPVSCVAVAIWVLVYTDSCLHMFSNLAINHDHI